MKLRAIFAAALLAGHAAAQDRSILASDPGYQISSLTASLTLHPDGSMDVQEEISVRFTQPRRGIKRFIPLRRAAESGGGEIRIDRVSAGWTKGKDGVKITRREGEIEIRLGRAEVLLAPGTVREYAIRYRVRGAILPRGDQGPGGGWTELYWNAVGPEWDAPISQAKAVIRPASGAWSIPKAAALRGRLGSAAAQVRTEEAGLKAGAGLRIWLAEDGASIAASSPLRPYEPLTIALGLDPAGFPGPGPLNRFWMAVEPVLPLIFPILAALVMPVVWFIWGRDLRVQDGPPILSAPALSPAQAGLLSDGRLNPSDLAAALASLAQKGFLTVKRGAMMSLQVDLNPSAPMNAPLPAEEAEVLKLVRQRGPELSEADLREALGSRREALHALIWDELTAAGYVRLSHSMVRLLWLFIGVCTALLAGMAGLLVMEQAPAWLAFGSAALAGVIVALYGRHMPRLTRKGAAARSEVRRLEKALASPPALQGEDIFVRQDRFERLTPYAVALGHERPWLHHGASSGLRMPIWVGDPDGRDLGDFIDLMVRVGRAASTPLYRSSESSSSLWNDGGGGSGGGFGGGGGFSSGGGFGGGGGSSW